MVARLYGFPPRAARPPDASADILAGYVPEGEESGAVPAPEEEALPSHPVLDTPPLPRRVLLTIRIVSALAVVTFATLLWLFWSA